MRLTVIALGGAISVMALGAQAMPMTKLAPSTGLVEQARVTCAYLTRDGYCVRPRKAHKKHHVPHRYYRERVYRPYEPAPADDYYWRYERPRPVIRVVPNYPPYDDGWYDNGDD
ncbi:MULTISPECIES: hypothetical protein [unclassified Mesorhizobium]|uniref:hypothetical protein n=1 Tax=unclassified Mesorhizobium TaxID=325217 RepID=UPI000ADB4102|nr:MULTISPECIES: hypothetical protein [unclassified Mesorhizobium]MBN9255226.1 hypothetical protein [Mesorhizobium sp.]